MSKQSMTRALGLWASALVLSAGCAVGFPSPVAANAPATQARGALISIDHLESMTAVQARTMAANFPGSISVSNGAELYRVVYWSQLQGRAARASGLLALPSGSPQRLNGVVAYFRGTNVTRRFAPSEPGRIDGNTEAAVFGGNGFAVVVPDYFGMGASPVSQPYLLTQPQVDVSIDMLRAVRGHLSSRGYSGRHDLMMMGFSQGGQVVAGVHRALERRPLSGYRLRGSVGIAGPYDLRGTSVAIANRTCLNCIGYIAWGTSAYAQYLGHDLGDALRPQYVGAIPQLFDGTRTPMQMAQQLSVSMAELLTPEFHAALLANRDTWFTRALDDNETWRWVPRIPFRAYFGEADVDVNPAASRRFHGYAAPRGGRVTLHNMGDVDHMESASRTVPEALAWFLNLSASQPVSARP
jgi:pimeloyl-ACP methyl ester carboxylesterase